MAAAGEGGTTGGGELPTTSATLCRLMCTRLYVAMAASPASRYSTARQCTIAAAAVLLSACSYPTLLLICCVLHAVPAARNDAAGMPSLAGRQPGLDNPNAASLSARDTGDHSDSMTQVRASVSMHRLFCSLLSAV
jgi:hypothetical protein